MTIGIFAFAAIQGFAFGSAVASTSHPDFLPVLEEKIVAQLTHLDPSNYTCDVGYIAYGYSGGPLTVSIKHPTTGETIKFLRTVGTSGPFDPGYYDGSFCRKFQEAVQAKLPLDLEVTRKVYEFHSLENPNTCTVRQHEVYEAKGFKAFEFLVYNEEDLTFRQNEAFAGRPGKNVILDDCSFTFAGTYDANGSTASCKGDFTASNLYKDELPWVGVQRVTCNFSGPLPAADPNAGYHDTYKFAVLTSGNAGQVSCQGRDFSNLYCSPNSYNPVAMGQFQSVGGKQTSGNLTIENKLGGLYLRFAKNFKTDMGPDLRVLLRDSKGQTQMIEVASLKAFNGEQEFQLPVLQGDLSKFDQVVIYCMKFHVDFGVAQIK